jgi:stringent starvation protein B
VAELIPTTPYMIRAIHEWCIDNGLTPHLLVKVDANTRVPMAYVKQGEIVLNINYSATKDLVIDQQAVSFSARFNGASQQLYIPIHAVKGIYARENGQGMFFESSQAQQGQGDETHESYLEEADLTNIASDKMKQGASDTKDKKGSHLKLVK